MKLLKVEDIILNYIRKNIDSAKDKLYRLCELKDYKNSDNYQGEDLEADTNEEFDEMINLGESVIEELRKLETFYRERKIK
jgi:hypothetical protein